MTTEQHINRTIWFLWLQGIDGAPPVVRACLASWRRHHPDWSVVVLDDKSMDDVVALPAWARGKLTPAQLSDLLRLRLLETYGGVWVDATTYCNRPLDEWLPSAMPSGFFAFSAPAPGYLLSSWFLAAEAGHPIVARSREVLEDYWSLARLEAPGPVRRLLGKLAYRALVRTPRTTEWWLDPPLRDWLRIYPFYAIHYAVARAVRTNPSARAAWHLMPRMSADGPHQLQAYGLDRRPDARVLAELVKPTSPLYKLTWKTEAQVDPSSTLSRLFSAM